MNVSVVIPAYNAEAFLVRLAAPVVAAGGSFGLAVRGEDA